MIARNQLVENLGGSGISSRSIHVASSMFSDFFDDAGEPRRKGWAKRMGQGFPSEEGINYIPSDTKGPCTDLLVIACEGRANFILHLNLGIACAIGCHSKLKVILIITDYWDEIYFDKHFKPAFKALSDQFPIASMVYSPFAGKWQYSALNF